MQALLSNKITVFSPASIANVSCGFHVLGFAIDNIGDINTIEKTANKLDLPCDIHKSKILQTVTRLVS